MVVALMTKLKAKKNMIKVMVSSKQWW